MKQTSKKLSEQKKARGTKKTTEDMSYVTRINPFPKFDW
jgi:hypothetical protein